MARVGFPSPRIYSGSATKPQALCDIHEAGYDETSMKRVAILCQAICCTMFVTEANNLSSTPMLLRGVTCANVPKKATGLRCI